MEGNLSAGLLAALGFLWLVWFSLAIHSIEKAADKLHAAQTELQVIRGEVARIRRATLHQGPYEP